MSLPSMNPNGQSSIRNFFKPKSPSYAPPPTVTRTQGAAPPPPPPPAAALHAANSGQNGPKSPLSPPPASIAPTRPPSLHPQATIAPILPEYIPALRRITSLLLPVNYPDSFYARLSDPLSSGAFSRVLLWSEGSDPNSKAAPKVIGGLVCRPEPSPFTSSRNKPKQPTTPDSQPNALYIQSLVLLAPYRQLGLAAALLDEVVRLAADSPFTCNEVYAHVWTDNEDGLRWYLARGFSKHGQVNGYYFKLKPDSAWIVRRQIAPHSNNTHPAPGSKTAASTNGTIPPSVTAAAANLQTRQTPTPPTLATTAPTPSPSASASSTLSPPPSRSTGPSPNRSPGLSYQNARPETEWNDLPADMHTSAPGSSASSRSSSAAPRKKRDRAYPAAAFGK
ncbi:hypothetical protein F5Y06DRAFT_269380 [Hypoxylon sp. FL0890]|nr:hypothetical protein F5Y06DRAFT_269380 [Hypoxylon sp. FL0890]